MRDYHANYLRSLELYGPDFNKIAYRRSLELYPDLNKKIYQYKLAHWPHYLKMHYQRRIQMHPDYSKKQWERYGDRPYWKSSCRKEYFRIWRLRKKIFNTFKKRDSHGRLVHRVE